MLSGPEERSSGSTKPPGSFALVSGRPREEKRGVPSASGRGRCRGLGIGTHRVPALGCSTGSASGQLPAPRTPARHARLQSDRQIQLVLFVKRPASKIKINKAGETENANLTAAPQEGCSTEPGEINSPSFLPYRVGFFCSAN